METYIIKYLLENEDGIFEEKQDLLMRKGKAKQGEIENSYIWKYGKEHIKILSVKFG